MTRFSLDYDFITSSGDLQIKVAKTADITWMHLKARPDYGTVDNILQRYECWMSTQTRAYYTEQILSLFSQSDGGSGVRWYTDLIDEVLAYLRDALDSGADCPLLRCERECECLRE